MSKYCKNCGKEISQNSKRNRCENCQNKTYGVIRVIGGAVLSMGLLVLCIFTKGKIGGIRTKF